MRYLQNKEIKFNNKTNFDSPGTSDNLTFFVRFLERFCVAEEPFFPPAQSESDPEDLFLGEAAALSVGFFFFFATARNS